MLLILFNETAEEALEELKHQTYDIIITDYRLPGINGLEFLKHLRSKNIGTMNILITAYGDDDVISEARRLGVQDIINKPFNSEDIETSLIRLIENNRGAFHR